MRYCKTGIVIALGLLVLFGSAPARAKAMQHGITLFSGWIPNDEFLNFYPTGLRYDFAPFDWLGFEAFGAYIFNSSSDLDDFLKDSMFINSHDGRTLLWNGGIQTYLVPLQGSFRFPWGYAIDVDIFFGSGVSVTGSTVKNRQMGMVGDGGKKTRVDVSGQVGFGMRVYLASFLALRADYRKYLLPSTSAYELGSSLSDRFVFPDEITLGITFTL